MFSSANLNCELCDGGVGPVCCRWLQCMAGDPRAYCLQTTHASLSRPMLVPTLCKMRPAASATVTKQERARRLAARVNHLTEVCGAPSNPCARNGQPVREPGSTREQGLPGKSVQVLVCFKAPALRMFQRSYSFTSLRKTSRAYDRSSSHSFNSHPTCLCAQRLALYLQSAELNCCSFSPSFLARSPRPRISPAHDLAVVL